MRDGATPWTAKDLYQVRMKQFFDHYLIERPEPNWMRDGVPQVHKGEPLE